MSREAIFVSPRAVVRNFLETLRRVRMAGNSLTISISNDHALSFHSAENEAHGHNWFDSIAPGETFDFIVVDLPMGMARRKAKIGESVLSVRGNWAELSKSLGFLDPTGICIALVEPPAFGIGDGPRFLTALAASGFNFNGVFNTPPHLLVMTSIRPVLVAFSRETRPALFAAELVEEEQAAQVAQAFARGTAAESLFEGIVLEDGNFGGFESLKVRIQLERLETQYKEYKTRTVGELAEEINTVRSGEQLQHKDNAIYIPMLGTSAVTDELSSATIKHHNFIQLVLRDDAISQYVSAFFRSELGLLILRSLTRGAIIPKISKAALAQARIALPEKQEQEEIIRSHNQLHALSRAIETFKKELTLNPRSASAIAGQADRMLEQIGKLTDVDRIMSMAREGESATVEFKQGFSLDVRKGTKEKYIELSSLKTIVAFLNTNGGVLLVGVTDAGDICGIGNEVKKFHRSLDAFLLYFKNQLKERVGEQYYPFISQRIVNVHGARVLMVDCRAATMPCYLDGKEFYVRTNPSTDKLEGPKLVEYVQNHFNRQGPI